MQFSLDDILFYDGDSPEQREAIRQACERDPALAEMVSQWHRVRSAVRQKVQEQVPDQHLFVLYALEQSGQDNLLSSDERALLDANRTRLASAVQELPGLNDVVTHVDASCAAFEEAWASHVEEDRPKLRKVALDREASTPRRDKVLRWSWRIAATVTLMAFVTVMVLILQRDQSLTVAQTTEGERQQVELSDGSVVRLMENSALTFADAEDATSFNRHVSLTGSAFFDIVPDQQGFTVETPTAVTTVLGTSFGIQADDRTMEVVLATGKIAVASKASVEQMVVLEPGQMSRVALNALPTTPTAVELAEALEWTGLIIFRTTPLIEVVDELSERFSVEISIPPSLEAEGFNGTFDVDEQTVEQMLDVLATAFELAVHGSVTEGFQLISVAG